MNAKARHFFLISMVAIAAFLAVGFATVHPNDWPFAETRSFKTVRNLSGPLGSYLAHYFFGLLGRMFAWLVPAALLIVGGAAFRGRIRSTLKPVLKATAMALLLGALFALLPYTRQSDVVTGTLGISIAAALTTVLGEMGSTIILIACLLLVLLSEVGFFGRLVWGGVSALFRRVHRVGALGAAFRQGGRTIADRLSATGSRGRPVVSDPALRWTGPRDGQRGADGTSGRMDAWARLEAESAEPDLPSPAPLRAATTRRRSVPRPPRPERGPGESVPLDQAALPSLSILASGDRGGKAYTAEQLKNWSDVLEDKLSNYAIRGRVTAVNRGPLVTTFEFEPAPGVKIKDIVSRTDDLALAMRARSLRLIAPIPGRSVVGIEIPNPDGETVYLYDVLKEIPERLRLGGIMIALGVDAIGKPFFMNLCSAPHLLIAGTTGSGKSVCLNSLLSSVLFQYRPMDLRLLLVDPKMVEFSSYNGIPHLLHPVITDPREAVRVFTYLTAEMERRNELLRRHGVKNIESFNSKVALGKVEENGPDEKLPYIVLMIDELGDLVLSKGMDIESLLSRLSNMARAVGIHMIVATQRPSVDVIVGKTKANFPARIAFRVASKVDSRTILDCIGAEKLLGRGDMLYMDAKHPEPMRLHGTWVSEEEIEHLVNHWKQYEYEESRLDLFEDTAGVTVDEERDPYFEDAKDVILHYRQGSTSLLQRRLHVGYARAARLLDQLERAGIVGPPEGSKPREVLITDEEGIGRPLED